MLRGVHMERAGKEINSTQSFFFSPSGPPLFLLSTHFLGYIWIPWSYGIFNNYRQRKDTWRLKTTWLWSETGKVMAASVLRNVPISTPSEDPLALHRKLMLTEYYWYFLTLFWIVCRCFWYMEWPALLLLCIVLMTSSGRAGEERRRLECLKFMEGRRGLGGVRERHGARIAPWSCCFSVCVCVYFRTDGMART